MALDLKIYKSLLGRKGLKQRQKHLKARMKFEAQLLHCKVFGTNFHARAVLTLLRETSLGVVVALMSGRVTKTPGILCCIWICNYRHWRCSLFSPLPSDSWVTCVMRSTGYSLVRSYLFSSSVINRRASKLELTCLCPNSN